jgi:peptidyl-prolyl cis-trans isomerase C
VIAAAIAAGLLFTASFAVAKQSPADDTVVATVNGSKITKKDVATAMQGLPQMQDADMQQLFPRVLDQMITEKLIADATKKAKIENTDEYKKRLAAMKDQLAKQMYVEHFLKDKVTDDAVKSEYDAFKQSNAGKEEIRARQILVSTEDEAKKIVKDLDGGAKFEDLAKQHSTGPSAQNGGEIPGYFTKEEMIPEIGEAAFALTPGTYTKAPVKSQFGWHILKVEEKRKRQVPDIKEVEAAIRNKLGQNAVTGLAHDLRAKADVKVFDMNGKPAEEPKKN